MKIGTNIGNINESYIKKLIHSFYFWILMFFPHHTATAYNEKFIKYCSSVHIYILKIQ